MNALVAFFSAGGTTARAAKALAKAADADLYEIKPAVSYTRADLNWTDRSSRSSVEINDRHSRPALADPKLPIAMDKYDVIFLGFPIWWSAAPTIINTFLESGDFTGKTIILFATSGGSGLGQSAANLRPSAPGADIVNGKVLNGRLSEESLISWIKHLKL